MDLFRTMIKFVCSSLSKSNWGAQSNNYLYSFQTEQDCDENSVEPNSLAFYFCVVLSLRIWGVNLLAWWKQHLWADLAMTFYVLSSGCCCVGVYPRCQHFYSRNPATTVQRSTKFSDKHNIRRESSHILSTSTYPHDTLKLLLYPHFSF